MSTISEKEAKETLPGGTLVGKDNEITDNASGGLAIGRSHKENGIKAINKATGQHIEFEGGEVIITKPAVEDNELREFEGQMLTNRQILSKINESGGGVSFAEKGLELPTELYCSGKLYKYGGETLTDYEITQKISKCGCNHDELGKETFDDGGELEFEKSQYNNPNITFDNFHINTFTNYKQIKTSEIPNREPNFVSNSGSKYWYIKETNEVIRQSNHWGRTIASCNWLLDGYSVKKQSQGISKLSDFHREFLSLLNNDNIGKEFEICKTALAYKGNGRMDIEILKGKYLKSTPSFYVFEDFKVANQTIAYVKPLFKIFADGGELQKSIIKLEKDLEKLQERLKITEEKETENFANRVNSGANVMKMKFSTSKSDELKSKIKDVESEILKLKEYKVYDLGSSYAGGAVTVWDRNQTENGDYKYIAFVYSDGTIKYLEKNLPQSVIDYVENQKHPENTSTEKENKGNYMLLARLKADNEYFLGNGNRNTKHLWANNVEEQIAEMKRLWNILPVKPEWLSMEDILEYEAKMTDKINQFVDTNKMVEDTNGNQQRKPKYKVDNYVTYKTGDIETETWVGIVKEVKDFGNEYAYRLDAYTTDVDPPMFNSEKTNETYEASLRPSKKEIFEDAQESYRRWKNKSIKKSDLRLTGAIGKNVVQNKSVIFNNENYQDIAFIYPNGKIEYLVNDLPEEVIKYIESSPTPLENKKQSTKKYDLNSSWSGGAVVVYDRNQSEYGDYKTIAHVFSTGEIKYFEDNLPKEVIEYVEKVKHPSNEKEVMPTNYQISDYKNPYEVNRAIERLIDSKEKDFTPNEIEFISNYSGYGGLEKQGSFSDEELKGLLYEYFTPDAVVKKMWALAYKYGFGTFSNPHILEPSVGTGNFFKYAPTDAELFGNEINNYSKRVCEILYPKAMITLQPFEKNFISKNNSIKNKLNDIHKYHLVIGNPPYGRAVSKYLAMGESDYTKATSFTEYFITRGLDLLHSGGLLIFVVGAEQYNGGTLFLDSGISVVKKNIFDKAQLVDAYRLPTKIFERTGVASEILVFKKK